MSLVQRIYFLLDVFQMTTIALVSILNLYHINGLHLFLAANAVIDESWWWSIGAETL